MKVRLALPSEAEALWDIRNQAIRHGCRESYDRATIAAWTPDVMPSGYRSAVTDNPFYVVEAPETGQPVATGFLDLSNGSVEAVFTVPAFLGKGMASLIVQAIKQEAIRRGFSQLTLSSTPNACAFYKKQGFSVIKEALYPSSLAGTDLRCVEMVCVFPVTKSLYIY